MLADFVARVEICFQLSIIEFNDELYTHKKGALIAAFPRSPCLADVYFININNQQNDALPEMIQQVGLLFHGMLTASLFFATEQKSIWRSENAISTFNIDLQFSMERRSRKNGTTYISIFFRKVGCRKYGRAPAKPLPPARSCQPTSVMLDIIKTDLAFARRCFCEKNFCQILRKRGCA